MLSINDFANKIKESLKNNDVKNVLISQVDNLILDALAIGIQFGKIANQTFKNFQEILELVSALRILVEAKVYNNEDVLSIYNRVVFENEEVKYLNIQLKNIVEKYQKMPENSNQQSEVSQICRQLVQYPEIKVVNNQEKLNLDHQQQQVNNSSNPYQSIMFKKVKQNEQNMQQQIQQEYQEPQFQFEEIEEDLESKRYAQQLQKEQNILFNRFEEEASLALILEEEEAERLRQYKKIKEGEKKNEVECKICLEIIPFNEMVTLNCSDIYHQKCLNQFCGNQISSRRFPLTCPSLDCKKPIIYADLSEVLDDGKLQEFQQYSFQQYVQSHGDEYSWCPTPDCQYIFIPENHPEFMCPVCKKHYCLACKIEYHKGMNCLQYRKTIQNEKRQQVEKVLDQQFLQFVQGSKFKQCPQCKFWVEKNEGCDHMTCRCKFQFCYACGGVYSKCACLGRRAPVVRLRRK